MWQPVSALSQLETQLRYVCSSSGDGKFRDQDFPPVERSIIGSSSLQAHCQTDTSGVTWKRPCQYAKNPNMFLSGTCADDVIQGDLGDCWFLGALATIANRADLIKQLIIAEHPEMGYYIFKFFKEGAWRLVFIDDFIPTRNNRPIFASCSDVNELWVPLIEKAYAKLHGSYNAIASGSIAFAFADLTGGVCENNDMSPQGDEWSAIQKALNECWLLGCSAVSTTAKPESEIRATGLLANHAYSIIYAQEITRPRERLIKLRNPWGEREWKGAWSDNSSEWTQDVMRQIAIPVTFEDDGSFWMSWRDFKRNFTKLIICHLYQDAVGDIWNAWRIYGAWKGTSAGGCQNHTSWINNPQFFMTNPNPSEVTAFVSVSQEDRRWIRSPTSTVSDAELFSIGLLVFKVADTSTRIKAGSKASLHSRSESYINSREVGREITLAPQTSYIVLPATFDPNEECSFVFSAFCLQTLQIGEVGKATSVEFEPGRIQPGGSKRVVPTIPSPTAFTPSTVSPPNPAISPMTYTPTPTSNTYASPYPSTTYGSTPSMPTNSYYQAPPSTSQTFDFDWNSPTNWTASKSCVTYESYGSYGSPQVMNNTYSTNQYNSYSNTSSQPYTQPQIPMQSGYNTSTPMGYNNSMNTGMMMNTQTPMYNSNTTAYPQQQIPMTNTGYNTYQQQQYPPNNTFQQQTPTMPGIPMGGMPFQQQQNTMSTMPGIPYQQQPTMTYPQQPGMNMGTYQQQAFY